MRKKITNFQLNGFIILLQIFYLQINHNNLYSMFQGQLRSVQHSDLQPARRHGHVRQVHGPLLHQGDEEEVRTRQFIRENI